MILLVKLPVPSPLLVMPWLLAVVGFCELLQTTPRAVTENPPSAEIFPPLVADMVEISEIFVVVILGNPSLVEKS